MQDVLIFVDIDEPKTKIVKFRYGTLTRELYKQDLINFLVTGTIKNLSDKLFYNSTLKSFYRDPYDFIIKFFDEITCIQVYKDNSIRLYTDARYPISIVFEDDIFIHDKINSSMLKKLIAFAKHN